MNRIEHLLTILAEECAEVAQRSSKALRFSLGEIQPGQEHTNAERIAHEMSDLLGVYEMLTSEGVIPPTNRGRTNAKKEKVAHFLSYSATQGTLNELPARSHNLTDQDRSREGSPSGGYALAAEIPEIAPRAVL